MKPKLSILMLTYNRLETSSACIQHILNNVGNIDFEFLVWDNGSTDGTYDWLEEYYWKALPVDQYDQFYLNRIYNLA